MVTTRLGACPTIFSTVGIDDHGTVSLIALGNRKVSHFEGARDEGLVRRVLGLGDRVVFLCADRTKAQPCQSTGQSPSRI